MLPKIQRGFLNIQNRFAMLLRLPYNNEPGRLVVRFHQFRRTKERQRDRCGFNERLCRSRVALAAAALLFVLVSAQGAGFLVHVLQLSAVDTDECFLDLICDGEKPGADADNRPILLRDSASAGSKNHHDCSTCILCQQFLSSLKIYRASSPVFFTRLSIGREHVFPFLDAYPSREIAPHNIRAPPLTDLI